MPLETFNEQSTILYDNLTRSCKSYTFAEQMTVFKIDPAMMCQC